MVDRKSDPVSFSFHSSAAAPDAFEVIGFEGTEEISRPYRYRIELVAEDPDIDLDKLLYAPATLMLRKGDDERRIHGVVTECRLSDAMPDQRYCYQVILRPRIWLLGLSRQNQIYQGLSVPDIVSQEIKADTAKGATKDAKTGLLGDDFELRLTRKYAAREYTVQYRESDLDFISRLMEHEGIFYFFEQGDERERVIITDNNIHFAGLEAAGTLPYRTSSGLDGAEDESVLSFTCINQRVPRKVVLKDYNYRLPHVMLQSDAEVDKDAHGLVCDYGEHFKTPEEGGSLARIRAQEMFTQKKTFEGTSDSIRLQAGWRFKLDEHFRREFNCEYVVTRMTHKGRQPLEGVAGIRKTGDDQAFYGNTLYCIPAAVDYRPPRRTPKPEISGLMNAHVDSAILESRAELDSQGRYKLVMPYDLSGAAAGKASRFVRKAQPYGGRDMGMHFPLYKGTEVVCSFVNGDPDRPIITGVVPNPATNSVVTSHNNTRNVVKTGHGSFFEFNDGNGPADKTPQAGSGHGQVAAQQQRQAIKVETGALQPGGPVAEGGVYAAGVTPLRRGRLMPQHQHQLSSAEESSPGGTTADDIWFRVKVPNYNSATTAADEKESYWRVGTTPGDEKIIDPESCQIDRQSPSQLSDQYSVQAADQSKDITCTENVQYTLTPDVTGITPTGYSVAGDTLGVAIDAASGEITADIGFDKSGAHTTTIAISYDDTGGTARTTSVIINWTITEVGNELPPGWYDYTDGDHVSVAMGNRRTITHGKSKVETYTKSGKPFYYSETHDDWGVMRKITLGHSFDYSASLGTKESYYGGLKLDGFVGGSNSVSLASTLKFAAGVNLSLNYDWNIKLGRSGGLNVIKGTDTKVTGEGKLYGTKIKLRVMDKPILSNFNNIWSVIVAIGTGVTGAVGAGKSALEIVEAARTRGKYDDAHPWSMAGMATAWGLIGAVEVAKLAAVIGMRIYAAKMDKSWAARKAVAGYPEISMDNKTIKLSAGNTSIELDGTAIILRSGTSSLKLMSKAMWATCDNTIWLKTNAGMNQIYMKPDQLLLKHSSKISVQSAPNTWEVTPAKIGS